MFRLVVLVALSVISSFVSSQQNRIDIIGDDAPALAQFGDYTIGVRTLEIVAENRIDIINTPRGGDTAYYDRKLMLEIWYPAELQGAEPGTQYQAVTRNPEITATLTGRAVRDAAPLRADGPYPVSYTHLRAHET